MKKRLEKFAYIKDTLYLCSVKRRGKIFDREEPYVGSKNTMAAKEKFVQRQETRARASGRRVRRRREDACEVVKELAEVVREVAERWHRSSEGWHRSSER